MSGQRFGHRLFSGCQFFPLAWTLTEVISHFVAPSASAILALLYLDKVSYYHIWTLAFSDHLKPPQQMPRRQSHVRQKGPIFIFNSSACLSTALRDSFLIDPGNRGHLLIISQREEQIHHLQPTGGTEQVSRSSLLTHFNNEKYKWEKI